MNKIKKYIEILELCLKEQSFEGRAKDFHDHITLCQEGYIGSVYGSEEPFSFDIEGGVRGFNIVTTPKGVAALTEWKKILFESSWKGRLFRFFDKLIWLIVGALISQSKYIIDSLFAFMV